MTTDDETIEKPERRPCDVCGAMVSSTVQECPSCGEPFNTATLPGSSGTDQTGGLIPYKNGPALIAYYLGVFSVIPCFPIGIAAVILGVLGLKKVRKTPEVKGTAHAWIGIIAGGLFGLLWTVMTIGVFAAAIIGPQR